MAEGSPPIIQTREPSGRPTLPELLALAVQSHRDEASTRRALRRRDRTLAVRHGLDREGLPARRRLRGWLRGVEGGRVLARLASGWLALRVVGVLLAALLGVLAALALFRYDGTRPVNVLAVVVVFVALPLVTAALSLVGMLGWLPGSGVLRALSPAGLLWSALQRLPGAVGESAGQLRVELRRHGRLLGGVGKWVGWSFSQAFGLWFVVAGIVTFLVLLATTDLAFGWATTLNLDDSRLQDALAASLWFYPEVTPSVEMIEKTITERATSFEDRYAASPDLFKAWWRPLLWLMVGYALVPRLVLAFAAWFLAGRAVTRAFDRYPGVDEIERRLVTPAVDTAGRLSGEGDVPVGAPDAASDDDTDHAVAAAADLLPAATAVIRWSDAPLPQAVAAATSATVLEAGGAAALSHDDAVAHRVAEGDGPVHILVKAWEPPLAEFADFLGTLREQLGDGRALHVVPVTRGQSDRAAAAVWRRAIAKLGDPWLRVSPVRQESTNGDSGAGSSSANEAASGGDA